MTVLATDTGAGSSGAAVNTGTWALGKNPTSGGGSVQYDGSGFIRWTAGSAGGYAYSSLITRAFTGVSTANLKHSFAFKVVGSNETYPTFVYRSTGAALDDTVTAYWLQVDYPSSTIELYKVVTGTATLLASVSFSYTTGTVYSCSVQVVGNVHTVKMWTGSEPITGGVDGLGALIAYTHTSGQITAAGACGMRIGPGSAASQAFWTQAHTLTDAVTTVPVTASRASTWAVLTTSPGWAGGYSAGYLVPTTTVVVGGTITAAGDYSRSGLTRTLTGSTAGVGDKAAMVTHTRDGSITASGYMLRTFPRVLNASITATGTIGPKMASLLPAGTIAAVNVIKRAVKMRPAGVIATVGLTIIGLYRRVFGLAGTATVTLATAAEIDMAIYARHRAHLTVITVGDSTTGR